MKNQATQKVPLPLPPPPEFNHSASVVINSFIPPVKSGKEVLSLWNDGIEDMINFVH